MVVLWARLTLLAILAGSTAAVDPRFPNIPEAISPAAACEDFAGNDIERPSWSLADCQGVWAQWSSVLPQHTLLGYMDRRLLQQTAEHLRREGLQCFVQLPQVGDGVGSSAIRSIITWMFAEEIGCNWAIPDWGRRRTDAQGRSKYCHAVTTINERANMTVEERRQAEGETCIYVNWLQYFGFDRHSVPLPEQGIAKTVVVRAVTDG